MIQIKPRHMHPENRTKLKTNVYSGWGTMNYSSGSYILREKIKIKPRNKYVYKFL